MQPIFGPRSDCKRPQLDQHTLDAWISSQMRTHRTDRNMSIDPDFRTAIEPGPLNNVRAGLLMRLNRNRLVRGETAWLSPPDSPSFGIIQNIWPKTHRSFTRPNFRNFRGISVTPYVQ